MEHCRFTDFEKSLAISSFSRRQFHCLVIQSLNSLGITLGQLGYCNKVEDRQLKLYDIHNVEYGCHVNSCVVDDTMESHQMPNKLLPYMIYLLSWDDTYIVKEAQ